MDMADNLPRIRLLLIEDNPADARLIREILAEAVANFSLCIAERLDQGLGFLTEQAFDLILLDLNLPDSSGLETLRKTCSKAPSIPVIILTGLADEQLSLDAIREGASDYLVKGDVSASLIVRSIRYAMERNQAEEERKRLEAQLLQSQKMEAVGQLASGIAHDFNNIINSIMGYSTLILMHMEEDDRSFGYFNEIVAASERAAHLTKSLLAFGRKQAIDVKPLSLNDTLSPMAKILSRFLGEDLQLQLKLSEQVPAVLADAGQLDQVLMNLASNARDAMPDGGLLSISTALVKIDDEFRRLHGFGKTGKYALISVEDTGIGMDEQTRQRIFEPFFTTKEPGKGTGLGLSMVYGIVKQHKGYINVYSEPDKGTVFNIYLPAINIKAEAALTPEYMPLLGGSETILMVEDDINLRKVLRLMLEKFGYTVLEASDGIEAIETFREHRDIISLVLMDLIMPGKNGNKAWTEMHAISPAASVLFTSGYTGESVKKFLLDESWEFISKPVSPRDLLHKIRGILDSKS
jgi:signal transduction histidine kinase